MLLTLFAVAAPTSLATMWWMSHEMMERDYPTPHEWSFRTRCYWHTAKALQDQSVTHGRIPDWSVISHALQALLARLENRDHEGRQLELIEKLDTSHEPAVYVTFDLSSVFDISHMPEPSRRGYFQALFEAAKTAEAMEKIVHDTTTQGLHMLEFVVGPSNPDPTPLPSSAHIRPPREEDCIRYYPSADPFYRKLLATKGLTTRQRIQSMISYGEWLDTKGRSEEAETHFRAALQVAASVFPKPTSVMNLKTGVLNHTAPYVTANIMDTTTALAVHLAQNRDSGAALPIFLSTLQAYRSCTVETPSDIQGHTYSGRIPTEILLAGLRKRIADLFTAVEYPPPPLSGNEPLSRSGDEFCKTSAAMIYAAEILFATAGSQRETALSWIKEALEKASTRVSNTSVPKDDRLQCNQCLSVALETWWSMAQQMKSEAGVSLKTFQQSPRLSDKMDVPRWRQEELEHWDWVKEIDRGNWQEKMMCEDWKTWSWFPMLTLRHVI